MGFLRFLWRSAMLWRVSPIEGVRTGSSLAGCMMFLVSVFTVIAIILVLLGFDLGEVDLWLEAQGGWIHFVGSVIFRICVWLLFLFSVLCCGVIIWSAFEEKESRGCGMIGGFLVFAFLAWMCGASLFAPL